MAGRGYDGHFVRERSQLDVAGMRKHVVDIPNELGGEHYSALSQASPHETSGCGCFEGSFERPTMQKGTDGFHKVRGQIYEC